jgi:antitoxin (DNA-binding transcriptional repressor) of toxin-antitoxin stability system
MSVGDFKARFSEALEMVENGEEIEILYGKSKEPVARLVPPIRKNYKPLLGCLKGKITFDEDNWKMTTEELLDL